MSRTRGITMGSIRKRHDRQKPYLARYRGPDGRERTKAFRLKVDAERWLLERERDRARGEWVDPALGRTTLAEWAQRYRAGRPQRADIDRSQRRNLLPEPDRSATGCVEAVGPRSAVGP